MGERGSERKELSQQVVVGGRKNKGTTRQKEEWVNSQGDFHYQKKRSM